MTRDTRFKSPPRVRQLAGHAMTLEHNGERRRDESAWTATCECGWTESHSQKRGAKDEWRHHLAAMNRAAGDQAARELDATRRSKPTTRNGAKFTVVPNVGDSPIGCFTTSRFTFTAPDGSTWEIAPSENKTGGFDLRNQAGDSIAVVSCTANRVQVRAAVAPLAGDQ